MGKINEILRKKINKKNRNRLKNKNMSVIASNCNGAFILHDLGVKFNSPFVNLWMKPKDFIIFLKDIHYYLECELLFVKEENIDYPVGILDDIKIYFQHYNSEVEAKIKWDERKKRIDFDNLFIIFTDRDGCTYEDLCEFDKLQYVNKIVFTNIKYKDIKSSYYIKGWEKEDSVGNLYEYKSRISGKKHYDAFKYVEWFNYR